MSRHLLDRPRPVSTDRSAQFWTRARQDAPHPATRALHQRPRTEAQRIKAFIRIERGR